MTDKKWFKIAMGVTYRGDIPTPCLYAAKSRGGWRFVSVLMDFDDDKPCYAADDCAGIAAVVALRLFQKEGILLIDKDLPDGAKAWLGDHNIGVPA